MSSSDRVRVYGLRHPTKCLATVGAGLDRTRFMVGTWSPLADNELHILELEDEMEEQEEEGEEGASVRQRARADGILAQRISHPQAIHQIMPCPYDPDLLFTLHDDEERGTQGARRVQGTLWRLPKTKSAQNQGIEKSISENEMEEEEEGLEKIYALGNDIMEDDPLESLSWDPRGKPGDTQGRFITAGKDTLRLWDIGKAGVVSLIENWSGPREEDDGGLGGLFGPRKSRQLVWSKQGWDLSVTNGQGGIWGYDIRSREISYSIPQAHTGHIRSLSCNPHMSHQLTSASEDRTIRVWDVRYTGKPLLDLNGHTHWVCDASYNPFHDRLLLTGGSDARVLLHSIYSVSSAALVDRSERDEEEGEDGDEDEDDVRRDDLLWMYDGHDDSVYGVAWSEHDPWVFATLGYGGRIIIGTMPDAIKYRILL